MKSLLFVAAVLLSVIGVHLVSIETTELPQRRKREGKEEEEEEEIVRHKQQQQPYK